METSLFLGIMAGLLCLYLVVGYVLSDKIGSSVDFLLAGKSLGVPAITATLLAAQVGGGMFLGTAQNPFHGLLYIFGLVLGLLILGLGLASKLRSFNVISIGEIFEKTYQSKKLQKLCIVLSITAFMGILIGQALAAKSLLLTFAGMENAFLFTLFWLTIISYTMIGGFHTVIITDFFRIIFITIVFSGICMYSLWTNPVSFFSSATFKEIESIAHTSDLTWLSALRIMLIPASFCLLEQDLAQKFFSARTQKIAGISALCASGLLLLFSFIPFYFGIQAKLLHFKVTPGISPLLPFLTMTTNTFFFTLALCALLSAIMSTTDSLLCAVSSVLTLDISRVITHRDSIFISRAIIFVTGAIALIASYLFSEGIIEVLVDSYEIALSALFIPFLGCLFLKELHPEAAWFSSIAGLATFLIFKIPYLPFIKSMVPTFLHSFLMSHEPWATFLTFGISFIAYGIGFLYGKRMRALAGH